jgi:tetratricopeptide (TPR) repeat protein
MSVIKLRLAPFVLVLALFAWGAGARAADPREQASRVFKEANDLYARGMFLDALEKYRQARKLYPSYKIDLNIGGTLDAMGRRSEAALFYERFLIQSAKAPKDIVKVAQERLELLRSKLGRVRITCVVEGALVKVDDKTVAQIPMELDLYLEAGKHTLRVEKANHIPFDKSLVLKAGEMKSLDVTLKSAFVEPDETTGKPKATQLTQGAPRAPGPASPDPILIEKRRTKTTWGYAALGTGGALALTAVILYGIGGSQGKSAYDSYKAATVATEIESHWNDVEGAKTKLIVADVLIGVAVAAIGVGIYQLVTRPSVEETRETRGSTRFPTLGLAPTPSGTMLSCGGAF